VPEESRFAVRTADKTSPCEVPEGIDRLTSSGSVVGMGRADIFNRGTYTLAKI
jgi:hypothetical protein